MRTTVLLVGLCAVAFAAITDNQRVSASGKPYKLADKTYLQRQKDILLLYRYVYQYNEYPEQVDISKNYNIESNQDAYTNQDAVQEFLYYYKNSLLPRDYVFSPFYEAQLQQARSLFHLFYYAKDFDTFYKTAAWARDHVNQEMYIYALTVAIFQRPDTQGYVVPPIYEVLPNYFYNAEVIQQAYNYKFRYGGQPQQQKQYPQGYTVNANYSGWYVNVDPEQSLAYFTEDVGLNALYYYYQASYPSWLGGGEYNLKNDRRGELFYYYHQQILARYYLERLSNGFGYIPYYDYEQPIETPYYPSLRYRNGLDFPARPPQAQLYSFPYNGQGYIRAGASNYSLLQQVQDYERRIRDAIDLGYVYTAEGGKVDIYTQQGLDILGNLIQSNPDSPNQRYYGPLIMFASRLLGYSPEPLNQYKLVPSALEHYQSALRDPIFYQFYKRLNLYFQKYKDYQPPYSAGELGYEGVSIESVDIDKLTTYFDYFEADITNAVDVTKQEYESDSFYVKTRQYRLNHRPFSYKINVQSDKSAEVSIRAFLGPKYDEYDRPYDINQNRLNFVQIDKFVTTIQAGKSTIERNSRQFYGYVRDRTPYRKLYQRVLAGLKGEPYYLDQTETYCGYFPNRLLLPKGRSGGQVYQLYVIVSPYKAAQGKSQYDPTTSCGIGSGSRYPDAYPFGYPFDRYINQSAFFVPNSYFEDVVIFHKSQEEINNPASRQ